MYNKPIKTSTIRRSTLNSKGNLLIWCWLVTFSVSCAVFAFFVTNNISAEIIETDVISPLPIYQQRAAIDTGDKLTEKTFPLEEESSTRNHEEKFEIDPNNSKEARKEVKQVQVHHDDRSACISPEKDIPWILNGTCEKQPHFSTFSWTSPRRSCGFCGDDAAYLRQLRDDISAKFEERCKNLVVYGAALGEKYEMWMRSADFLGKHTSKVVKRHGTCFFMFITDANDTGALLSADGSQNLIVIDPTKLPYKNNRRNTKLFKLNPGLLFPWADRVIWQDAKLQWQEKSYGLPSDYLLHFNRTVHRFGTCSSFMGLPHHDASVRMAPVVNLKAHCDTVIAASKQRPEVSDSLDVLRSQCERSEEKLTTQESGSEEFDEAPLVDTAFIVYDMRTPKCRQFNGNLGCSWLDEIHCYSDRDQISFPLVVANLGLTLSSKLRMPGHELRDRVYVNENNVPMLHIAKRSCHWYYRSFSRCVAPEGEEIGYSDENNHVVLRRRKEKGYRVAVLVAGTLERLMLTSTLGHFIRPMIKTKTAVDFYASLTIKKAETNSSDTSYAEHLQPDPILPANTFHDSVEIEDYVRKQFGPTLAKIGALQIQESIDIDSEPMLKARRERALIENPNEDPDQRFPFFDNRSAETAQRTVNVNRNYLRKHLAINKLWTSAQKWEAEEGFKYDYIIFLREEALWLNDFDILNIAKKEGDIFIPSCDARDPLMDPNEINDHILISRRDTAELFGNYYSTLFQTDVKGCTDRLPQQLTKNGQRGCNSEMLLKWVTEEQNVKVTKLPQSEVPFQLASNIKLPDGSNMQCFQAFCQSNDLPLQLTDEDSIIKRCKQIDWDAFFPVPKMEKT